MNSIYLTLIYTDALAMSGKGVWRLIQPAAFARLPPPVTSLIAVADSGHLAAATISQVNRAGTQRAILRRTVRSDRQG